LTHTLAASRREW